MVRRAKTVSKLVAALTGARLVSVGDSDPEVLDLTHDSRRVTPGAMYVALRGANSDGHDYVAGAVEEGAVAVCVDHEIEARVPQVVVSDTREAIGPLAAEVHDHPSATLDVIGVTGTNGKTTVTHFIESIAAHAGLVTGLIGTIHTRYDDVTVESVMTTPEASDLQRLLGEMRDAGVSVVATEVSSHSLAFGRVKATRFAIAAFTNLSQDHLDFHGDMERYRAAKERLFSDYEVGTAVINIDDPVGREIAAGHAGKLLTVGTVGDVSVSALIPMPGGSRFTLSTPWGRTALETAVLGEFNVTNLVMAGACCLAVGVAFDEVVEGMRHVDGVPGRFEIVSGVDPIVVIVDYAHTPEGVATAVATARSLTEGKVVGLLGAGGDRDRAKRPAMGSALSDADVAVVTSDNPRSEDPVEIARTVWSGLRGDGEHILELDRRVAIDLAIDRADDGDIVLILGRGHEPYQQIGDERVPFDDREVAARSLERRRKSANFGPESGSITT